MPNKSKARRKKAPGSKVVGKLKDETAMRGEGLVFDYHTIRLIIGLIAIIFPLVVRIRASQITDSISWSYHTDARDFFVGFLFVLGAFLMSYKGHKPTIQEKDLGKFWKWVGGFWRWIITFRIWERKHEEDLVGWIGGIAAWVTALFPTSICFEGYCPPDWRSNIHYLGAIMLFSTTVYFCLVGFLGQVNDKIRQDDAAGLAGDTPRKRRKIAYLLCGWGIAIFMVGLLIVKIVKISSIPNVTFWVETVVLELFGIAWAVSSQYLPFVTDEKERQKLF